MSSIDYIIFVAYFLGMVGVGVYYFRQNTDQEDYYVGGRSIGPWHIGLSVVATDVGGGFSIGLGGLGFIMGLSGTWMLFTGLIGAWLAAVLLIPRVSPLAREKKWLTFPQLFEHFYNYKVALVAGVISAVGYLGFTSSQLLAGAKLASATFDGLNLNMALIVMGVIAVGYTVIGGLKAVIYTDTIQWIILMSGLIFIGLPLSYYAIGGIDGIRGSLGPEFLALDQVGWVTFFNWLITIGPIWFVGMTLYQRIYASRSVADAKKAWYIAGLFEYPVMAFIGVCLGLFARVAADQGMFESVGYATSMGLDPEMGLPLLLKTVLPAGLLGLMLSAYFSAIMSTADSCLMAASGNVVSDILAKIWPHSGLATNLRISQWVTLAIGIVAVLIATTMQNVLELMLLSYAFMVSGLFIPVLGALFLKRGTSKGAFWSMIIGGSSTAGLILANIDLPWGLDANFAGILASCLIYLLFTSSPSNDQNTSLAI
jgi:SSS family solute:Na+ symporter